MQVTDAMVAKAHAEYHKVLGDKNRSDPMRAALTAALAEMWRKAIDDVAAERQRQSDVEGWTQDHDDRHSKGEMALAAACYAAPVRMFIADTVCGRGYEPFTRYRDAWPWADEWWKPKDRRNDLVRAAALIIAEIERLDRLPAPPMGK